MHPVAEATQRVIHNAIFTRFPGLKGKACEITSIMVFVAFISLWFTFTATSYYCVSSKTAFDRDVVDGMTACFSFSTDAYGVFRTALSVVPQNATCAQPLQACFCDIINSLYTSTFHVIMACLGFALVAVCGILIFAAAYTPEIVSLDGMEGGELLSG